MKISLIIPVYNRLHLLAKCLLSIGVQSLQPHEIILTDDGSEEDILGLYQTTKNSSKIPMKLVRQEHQGFRAGRARNNGVSIASGDILVFVDQDILLTRGYLNAVQENLKTGRFLSAYPIRLSESQTAALNDSIIQESSYHHLVTQAQTDKIHSQFRKDRLNFFLYRYTRLVPQAAKLRGGVSSIYHDDFIQVNGYDENYVGWGNEDDDLGRRLLASGRIGYNFAYTEFPLHMHHEPFHQNGIRTNREYNRQRRKEISRSSYACTNGINSERKDVLVY